MRYPRRRLPGLNHAKQCLILLKNFRYEIRSSDFANTTSWDPESGEPPLSPTAALRVERGKLGLYVESPEIWKVRAIDLVQFGNNDKWHYRIRFMCFGLQCRGFSDRSFTSLVKLDGTLIEPKRLIEVN